MIATKRAIITKRAILETITTETVIPMISNHEIKTITTTIKATKHASHDNKTILITTITISMTITIRMCLDPYGNAWVPEHVHNRPVKGTLLEEGKRAHDIGTCEVFGSLRAALGILGESFFIGPFRIRNPTNEQHGWPSRRGFSRRHPEGSVDAFRMYIHIHNNIHVFTIYPFIPIFIFDHSFAYLYHKKLCMCTCIIRNIPGPPKFALRSLFSNTGPGRLQKE